MEAARVILKPSNLGALRAAWRAAMAYDRVQLPQFDIQNSDTPKLYISGVIGLDDSPGDFVKAVHTLEAKTIDVHINSPGGFVWDAIEMHQALVSHPATVTVHIDGLAASAASFLAMAGDTRTIAQGGRMMIHDAQGVGIGSPSDMREYADLLDSVSDDIAGIYAARSGGKPAAWRAAMTATTWYSAAEAVGAGLADRVSTVNKKTSGTNLAARMLRARAAVALEGVSK